MSAQLMNRGGLTSSFRNNSERKSYPGNNEEVQDNDANDIIKLQLRKPKAWNWELSTSKSSPNIAFPRIMLYNEKGKLLADAQEADCIFRGPAADCQRTQSTKTTRSSSTVRQDTAHLGTGESNRSTPTPSSLSVSSSRTKKRRSSTTNLPEINECLDDLVDHLESKGINYKLRQYTIPSGTGLGKVGSGGRKLKRQISSPSLFSTAEEEIEENYENQDKMRGSPGNEANGTRGELKVSNLNNEHVTSDRTFASTNDVPEIPIYVYSEKGMLQRDLNAKEFHHLRKPYEKSKTTNLENIQVPDEAPSKSKQNTPQGNGKSSLKPNKSFTPVKEVHFDLHKSKSAIDVGQVKREKKLCRRANSSGPSKFSGSILERMSAFKRHSSSTDSQDVEFTIVEHGPRYFLRTSNAGTLVVCEESFRNRKVRRRPKSCSRISEYEEFKTSPIGKERVIQEYAYLSNSKNYHSFEEPYYYDEAIARIDKLISKVALKGDRDENVTKYRSAGDVRAKNETVVMGSRVVSAPTMNRRGTSNSSLMTIGNGPDQEQCAVSDTKVKRKKKKLRRCLSASTVLLKESSSDEECVHMTDRSNRGRSKVRTKSRDELRRKTVQLDGLNEGTENGDQILTLNNNNISAVQSIGSSADIIEEPSDEVLLRLVQRLASIKQSQKDTSLNIAENPETPNDNSDASTIKEDENRNYKNQYTSIAADSEDFQRNNNTPTVQRQTTLLSHELLIEEDSHVVRNENSEDESSDVSNEYTSYTIESVNDLNGYSSQQSKEHSPYTFVENDINEEEEQVDDEGDNYNGSFVECTENELVGTNARERAQENNLLVDESNMGSNVSRNSGKGLTGRRTQSSGNLYSGKREHQQNGTNTNGILPNKASTLLPGQGSNATNYNVSNANNITNSQKVSETCPGTLITSPLCGVSKKDRNKFCGSLPNHLDSDDIEKDSSISDNYNVESTSATTERIEYVTVAPRRSQQQHQYLGSSQQRQQHQLQQQQQSPYNNSLSEKETASTSSGSSTFKISQDRPDIQLKLPLARSNFDPSCDQGYGSERSPEDEIPPPMPHMTNLKYQSVNANPLDLEYNRFSNPYAYEFISKDCTFPVKITKGPRGLGLSISGGIDSNAPFPGLIRIKRLFPHQAAWSTGQLQPGDIILEVNGISLTGLTNYEALEVLRTMPNDVVLLICRPNDEQYLKLSPPTEPPKPPQRTQQQGTQTTLDDEIYPLQPLTPLQTNFTGEFEIIMVKQQGSLGFTLRKEDESVLGHYVRALVREPATTDGRIKPGDKIVAVNDVPLSAMTHEQAVIFLRQAADTVKLRLYRDEAQTPVAAMSPTNSESKTICGTMKKTFLRPEAINLLSDLAYKKQSPSANSTESSIKSTNSSPRRLKRGTKANNSEVNSQSEQDTTDSKSSSNPQYLVSSQTTSVCSDSEQSIASQCTYIVQSANSGEDNELFKMPSDEDRPDRPSFLDLTGQSGSTPVVPRKPRFQFSVATNAYELNNLDNDALDAPIYTGSTTMTLDGTTGSSATAENQLPGLHEFTSLPCETFLIACKTESDLKNESEFNHKNALHQSFNTQQNNDTDQAGSKKDGNKSLLKWKGVVFSPEDEDEQKKPPSETDSSCAATAGTNPTPATERDFDLKDFSSNGSGYKVITVELNRGWNSRLGFSLQPHPETHKTFISAIYNDSVAARDGRLRVGDQLLTINDESVENMPTSEIIDLMRIIRGSIAITVLRKDDPH